MAQRLRCDRFDLLPKSQALEDEADAEAETGALLVTKGNAPQWRAAAKDLPVRRRIVRRVLALLQTPAGHHVGQHAALVAKRVELALYSRADSLDEYASPATLRRRVQALVAASVHEAHAHAAGKRSSVLLALEGISRQPKRQRRVSVTVSEPAKQATSVFPRLPSEDLTRAVLAFLDGKQVLRLRALNSLARALLPSCVFSIRLDVSQLQLSLLPDTEANAPALAKLTNLRQLVIHTTTTELEPSPAPLWTPLQAWSCAELPPTAANDGELAVCELACALRRFPRLESLQLPGIFCSTSSRNAARQLADALAAGACPRLRDLVLGGNHLADAGAVELARAVAIGGLPELQRLDLRRNYIGDRGAAVLLAALGHPVDRHVDRYVEHHVEHHVGHQVGLTLCLGGNLLTDASVDGVVALVQRARLAFLGLEDNFLTAEGVAQVVRGSGGH